MHNISESRFMLIVIFPTIDLNVVLFPKHYYILSELTKVAVNIVMPFAVKVNTITDT